MNRGLACQLCSGIVGGERRRARIHPATTSASVCRGAKQQLDVCIIGGGLLGATTAYYAARAGMKVVLLEERELASGASGAAFGGVSIGIYSYSSARVPQSYVELSKASLALYREAQEEIGAPLDLDAPGSIDPFYSEEGTRRGRERAEGLKACGVPCEFLDYKQIKEIEPAVSEAAVSAIYCPVDAHVTPLCVSCGHSPRRRAGSAPRSGPMSALSPRSGAAIASSASLSSEGAIYADTVVNTAGAWRTAFDRWYRAARPGRRLARADVRHGAHSAAAANICAQHQADTVRNDRARSDARERFHGYRHDSRGHTRNSRLGGSPDSGTCERQAAAVLGRHPPGSTRRLPDHRTVRMALTDC